MPFHTANPTTFTHEKTLTLDSSISQDHYPGFPKTFSPGGNTSDESGPTVPPNHEHRTLVLCFDGTGMWIFIVIFRTSYLKRILTLGDQFDDDVRPLLFSRSQKTDEGEWRTLEFEYRAFLLNAEEECPETAARLLSGRDISFLDRDLSRRLTTISPLRLGLERIPFLK